MKRLAGAKTMSSIPTLDTARLHLAAPAEEHVDALFAMYGDLETTRFIPHARVSSRTAAWFKLATQLGHWQLRGFGFWMVIERGSGEVVGNAGLMFPAELSRAMWAITESARRVSNAWVSTARIVSLAYPFRQWILRAARSGRPHSLERRPRHRYVVTMTSDLLTIGPYTFRSRLFVGTGKYKDVDETERALIASGAEVITVAVRRVQLEAQGKNLMSLLTEKIAGAPRFTLLPNTAGCYTADEAVRTCRLARELGLSGDRPPLVKLEVIGDKTTLFPDNEATLEAARVLVKEGFIVLPYCIDDPIVCRKLEELGCAAVMPLAAPIGSGLGIRNRHNIAIIKAQAKVPVIVDAGVGTASDAAIAMELGCDGVLMNTAIALAKNPVLMAEAMREGVSAGRKAFLAGRMEKKLHANASSPLGGLIE